MPTAKILVLKEISNKASIDQRSTRFIITQASDSIQKTNWQIFYQKVPVDSLPEYDIITPVTENVSGVNSEDRFQLNIVLKENARLKIRVRFQLLNEEFLGWTNFFEFTSLPYKDFARFPLANFSAEKIVKTQGKTLTYETN